LLSFDMGGTTAKACVIDDCVPLVGREFEVARADRFKKGSGLPIRVPVIELIEIGAGGGSIARVDRMGLLKVGPDSAGADPGPACYNLGGRQPTVTDADLLLGYLDAEFFLGGRMRLDRAAAQRAIEEHVARPLGLDVTQAAWAAVNQLFAEMEAEGRALLTRAGVAASDVRVARIAEMRYLGQGHEVEAAVPLGNLSAERLPTITASFEAAYRALYHRLPQG